MKTKLLASFALAWLALLAGCVTPPPPTPPVDTAAIMAAEKRYIDENPASAWMPYTRREQRASLSSAQREELNQYALQARDRYWEETRAAEEQARADYIATATHRPKAIRDAIAEKRIAVGMLESEVLLSWLEPNRKHIAGGSGPTITTWVYSRGDYRADYLHFRDGVLVRWSLER